MRGTFLMAGALCLALAGISSAQEFVPPFADASGYLASTGIDVTQAPIQKGDLVQAPDLGKEGPACDFDCCFKPCQYPCVYFQVDALYWDRIGTGCDEALVINTTTTDTLFSSGDLDFDGAPGARFLIGWQPHHCSHCCAWELSYWGVYNWNADGEVTGAGDLAIPGDLGLVSNNFFGADQILLDYRSELHNVELNCIRSCCVDCAKIDFIAGFRYLALNDQLDIIATDLQETTGVYSIDTHNDLYGVQLGGRLTRPMPYCCRWGLELTGKAGIFYNDISTDQFVDDFGGTTVPLVLRDVAGSRDGVAMLGEIGIVAIRPINECWNLRLGYTALGLGGVALAPDQVDFTFTPESGTEVHHTGWIFAHGATAGLERRW
ncbi:MAG: BBP7 family outer membrane beta-barrel protein [Planctomycetaceae bacterium]|nr:BBP7 family outer membrane beta-barrel protein [Planctomycetaceae bacterium]